MQAHEGSEQMKDAPDKIDHGGRAFVTELRLISQVKCRECGGYGHHRKLCPTYSIIQQLTTGVQQWKTYANRAREADYGDKLSVTLAKRQRKY